MYRLALELLLGLVADIPYFTILSFVEPPKYVDKYLFQWIISLIRIVLFIIIEYLFPVENIEYFQVGLLSYFSVIAGEIILNATFSFYRAGITWKHFNTTTQNSWFSKGTYSQIIVLIFLFPLSEEIFFRVFLFRRWITLIGFFPALVLQSCWFLVNHSPFLWVRAFRSISYALAFYLSGGSLFAAWLCHVTNNIIAFRFDSQKMF